MKELKLIINLIKVIIWLGLINNAYSIDCITCRSSVLAECATLNGELTTSTTCDIGTDLCYVFITVDGGETVRGCEPPIDGCTDEYYCEQCDTNNCNNQIYPDDRAQCIQCIGDNCNEIDLQPYPCRYFNYPITNEEEICYSAIVDGTLMRGCLTDMIEFDCTTENNCHTCNTDGCNTYEFNTCIVCDSATNANCYNTTQLIEPTECPVGTNPFGCFTEIEGGQARRGCLSTLSETEYNFCTETSTTCKACNSDRCNEKNSFPYCVECKNEEVGPYCFFGTELMEHVICQNYYDECFVHVVDDTVTRGCMSDMPNLIDDCEDPMKCLKCDSDINGPLCNGASLPSEFCTTCNSDEDPSCKNGPNTLENRIQCSLAVQPHGCYTFDNGEIVIRGCVNHIEEGSITSECKEENSLQCDVCYGSECNREPMRCVTCIGQDCRNSPNLNSYEVCQNADDKCYMYTTNTANFYMRGCLSAALPTIQEACQTNNTLCRTCTGGLCNDIVYPPETCLYCDSNDDENCRTNPNQEIQCYGVAPYGCYLFDDTENVKRGCVANLIQGEINFCSNQQSQSQCKICTGNNCNAKETFTTCQTCNSGNNLSCIRNPSSTTVSICGPYYDECYTHVENEIVIRGCLSNANTNIRTTCTGSSNANNDICQRCSDSNNCNNEIVTGDICVECDSEIDADCINQIDIAEMHRQCPFSVKSLGCFRFEDYAGTLVKRGCMSSLVSGERTVCRQTNSNCKMCTEDDCNAKVDFQRCLSCNENNDYCMTSPEMADQITCRNYMDECFLYMVDDETYLRGCIGHTNETIQNECSDNDNCLLCSGHNCNNASPEDSCIVCNSGDGNESCRDGTNLEDFVETCTEVSAPSGCYRRVDESGNIIRGCVSSLEETVKDGCLEQSDSCKTCVGANCNNKIDFTQCLQCTSEESGLNCFSGIEPIDDVICQNYYDECFIHVANNSITRGCLKTRPNLMNDCEDPAKCIKCDSAASGMSCNDDQVVQEYCTGCNSSDDVLCKDGPNSPENRIQCNLSLQPHGCYTFDNDEITIRGCMNQIDDRSITNVCNEENNSQCDVCIGNECNRGTMKCVYCIGLDCRFSPNHNSYQDCENFDDRCFMYTTNTESGYVRGCLSRTSVAIQESCQTNNKDCETCSGRSYCNDIVHAHETCMYCDSNNDENCLSNPDQEIQCFGIGSNGCYFFDDTDNVKRGCVSDLTQNEINYCNQVGQTQCVLCMGNNCNIKVAFPTCRTCNSETDPLCINSEDTTSGTTCQLYDDECYTHVVNNTVIRGCLSSAEANVRATCTSSSNANNDLCKRCSDSDNCNNEVVVSDTCLECNSDNNPDCINNLNSEAMQITCPLSINSLGCYRFEDNAGALVKRGCMSSLVQGEITNCRQGNNNCKSCTGNNCNQKETFTTCRTCNSLNNLSCIRSPGSTTASTCQSYYDECYTHVENDIVIRGCLSNDQSNVQTTCSGSSNANNDICQRCSNSNNCNNEIVTGDICVECDSNDDINCINQINIAEMHRQCPFSVKSLGCYRFEDNAGALVKRGCMSSLVQGERSYCRQANSNCKMCMEGDCNAKVTFTTCRTCNSGNNPSCVRSPSSTTASTCRSYYDECYTHVENEIVIRGCLSNANTNIQNTCTGSSNANNDICQRCENTNNCNNVVVTGDICVECDSEIDADCINQIDIAEMHRQCPFSVKSLGCYRFEDYAGALVRRGCMSSLVQGERSYCRQTNSNCKMCTEGDCNAKVDFQRCLSCNQNNDYCMTSPEMAEQITCRNYMDECFLHIVDDETYTRGCIGHTNETMQNECSDNDNCFLCSGNYCNNASPEDTCIVCNSAIDEGCRNGTNMEMYELPCAASAPAGCYRRVDEDNNVIRGCVSSLEETLKDDCLGQSDSCKTCADNNCNSKIDFAQCVQCTFEEAGPYCFFGTELMDHVICENYYDECFAHVADDSITRGCLKDRPNLINDCEDPYICTKCDSSVSGPLCNQDRIDAEFCTTCNSDDNNRCENGPHSLDTRVQCNLAVQPHGCYTFNDGETVTRGCVNHIEDESIVRSCNDENNEQCEICYGNECNKLLVSCFACTGTNCRNTVDQEMIEDCDDECFVYTSNNAESFTRGCISRASTEIKQACQTDNSNCKTCIGNNCNDLVPVADETCIHCDSNNDDNCRSNLDPNTQQITCYGLESIGCYLFDDMENVKRGCLSHITQNEINYCNQLNQNQCKTCTGNNCNVKTAFQTCYSCTSENNENCIEGNGDISTTTCRDYMDTCRSVTTEGGYTIRGCSKDTENIECQENLCDQCTENNCNTGLFPVGRPLCYQCLGDSCETVTSTYLLPCTELYSSTIECYMYFDGTETQRGCLLPGTTDYDTCNSLGNNCRKCTSHFGDEPLNGCNSDPSKTPAQLSCINCSDNTVCAWGIPATQGVRCTENVRFTDTETCYISRGTDGMVTRGCTLDSSTSCSGTSCTTCIGNSCNNENVAYETCLRCSTNTEGQSDCRSDAPSVSLFTSICTNNLQQYSQRGCFTSNINNEIRRGCGIDLTSEQLAECRDEAYESCFYCDNRANCNDNEAPSGAASFIGSISLIITIYLLSKFL